MRSFISRLSTLLLASIIFGVLAWAQVTAQISGTVRDQSGAVLPGVEISATQTETGIVRKVVTNETGFYVLSNLAIPREVMSVSTYPGQIALIRIPLAAYSSAARNQFLVWIEHINVHADTTSRIETTQRSGVGQVIENARILELPLNGRNVTDLIALAGGAVVGRGGEVNGRNFDGSARMNIGGQMIYSVEYRLDGADYSNTMSISSLPMPFPDPLQEFKVETSGVSVQNAKGAGISYDRLEDLVAELQRS